MEPDPASTAGITAAGPAPATPVPDVAGPLLAPDAAPANTRRLIMAAVLRGLFLDEPSRHAYLRDRWIGQ